MGLQAIQYVRGRLKLLDQRRLPLEETWLSIESVEAAWSAIKDMVVRGAPAIAIAAALALAAELIASGSGRQFSSADAAAQHIKKQLDYLVTSRPTAVNLSDAAQKLSLIATKAAEGPKADASSVVLTVVDKCEVMLKEDVQANKAIGQHGLKGIRKALQARNQLKDKIQILTHCNTGSLATAEYGTALGVVRATAEAGSLQRAYCTETRPYNQGARLTAYELMHDGLPATLICDSAAAALMAQGKVDAIVVGADRVAANGDTANKIGTYSLAVLAKHHNIPFFVAAPTTTLDPNLPAGSDITIEHRPGSEVTHFQGKQVAPDSIDVWNPCFDVTPATLIEGVITERGLLPNRDGAFDVPAFMQDQGLLDETTQQGEANGMNGHATPGIQSTIPGFQALDIQTVKDYLAERDELAAHLGPKDTKSSWQVQEVGDGNINFVYIVKGPKGALCLKQGLPFVRIAQDWPLTQDRVRYEADALRQQHSLCPEHVPALYHFDAQNALIVMQYLPPPHVILRRAIVQGAIYPKLAGHIAHFLAHTLFKTSLIALSTSEYRLLAERFRNGDMCRLTEQVIFTDPYHAAPVNSHTNPHLDELVHSLRSDTQAKLAASSLKAKFIERSQALLHGDMHTGSLMVTQDTTYAIDAEFAVYGPIAFDVGKFMANLLLAFFALDGHSTAADTRSKQRGWLYQAVVDVWQMFQTEFLQLWDQHSHEGDAYPAALFGGSVKQGQQAHQAAQQAFMAEVFVDALKFGGAVMIRRIVGIAHVDDFRDIKDDNIRAVVEERALRFGRRLLLEQFDTISDVVRQAEKQRHDGKKPLFEFSASSADRIGSHSVATAVEP
ncbi:TPA: hypothetical protein ACH3X3_004644 [Trebouxia sp. C0006]